MPPLILASASPRRRELLRDLGVSFEVVATSATEFTDLSPELLTAPDLARANARLKASDVAKTNSGRWVLGADTVVYTETQLFGKPRDMDEARQFLRALSGRVHEVITACILVAPEGREQCCQDISQVTFRTLSEKDITKYLAAVQVLDKAGAYALQEKGDWIIDSVAGSRHNVIGLPTEKLAPLLTAFAEPCEAPPAPLQT